MKIPAAKRVGELLLYGVFIVADAEGVWPHSHFLAIVVFVGGTIGPALYDGGFTNIQMVIISISALALSLCAHLMFSYPKIPDIEITGTLQPANDPTPSNACGDNPEAQGPSALRILMGGNTFVLIGMGRFTAVEIGTCPTLVMERTAKGIGVNADLYNNDGKLIARIFNNQLSAISGEASSVERNGDLSTIIVKDKDGKELLYVRYLNPTTVRARGVFGCQGRSPVVIDDNRVKGRTGEQVDSSCFVQSISIPTNTVGIHLP